MASALILVDLQNDFITGTLKVPNAKEIIPSINGIRSSNEFKLVCLTSDWHPIDHVSFKCNHLKGEIFGKTILSDGKMQELWPIHCVQNSEGAEFYRDLIIKEDDVLIRKGIK
jgi:nicotinamidase/pyrazinamidase